MLYEILLKSPKCSNCQVHATFIKNATHTQSQVSTWVIPTDRGNVIRPRKIYRIKCMKTEQTWIPHTTDIQIAVRRSHESRQIILCVPRSRLKLSIYYKNYTKI
jgi:hypothetical protein